MDKKAGRLQFVDGLRGVAAMMVVIYHFRGAISDISPSWIWPWFDEILGFGFLGVDVFFVISGFVIWSSVRNYIHTPAFFARFALRRSIRLDPPYWVTLALQLAAIVFVHKWFPAIDTPFPSVPKIASLFVYLQDLLGYGDICIVFWTLCYEVQFYVAFVGALVLAQALGENFGRTCKRIFVVGLGTIAFGWSTLIFFSPLQSLDGLFLERWFQFFLGALAMESVARERVTLPFIACWMTLLVCSALGTEHLPIGLATLFASGILVLAGTSGNMQKWLSARPFQFLGRISYSLYLLHSVIGWRFIKSLRVLNGSELSSSEAWAALFLGCSVTVLSAWAMYLAIERPSLSLCHRVSLKGTRASATTA